MSKIPPFYIKQYDAQPYYPCDVIDSDGDPVDLAGASIVCTMKNTRTNSLQINRQSVGINVTSEAGGQFEYKWQTGSGDTDVIGKYHIEFEITPASGGKFTLPVDPRDVAEVYVVKSLDTS